MSQSRIFVGGAGGIGSWLSLFLVRTGANVYVLDFDTVEELNLAGQCYGVEDVGKAKVDALSDVITRLCGLKANTLTPMNSTISEETSQWKSIVRSCDVVCVGFDNLKARRMVYEEWKANGKAQSFFVDGRLTAESGQVFTLWKTSPAEDFKAYEQTYFSDDERIDLPCSMKATTHCGAFIGSMMTAQITNWFNDQTPDAMPRETGNFEFHLQLMLLEQPAYKLKPEPDVVEL
jgi:molybdopterin/thiamine biosynthesis adenylyltransferase